MSTDYNCLRTQILANARFMIQPHHHEKPGHLDVVVFGSSGEFTAAVMVGLIPAIEGAEGNTPDQAVRKLLLTTCEMLKTYVPKVGSHQRVVHGGGVFDEDVMNSEVLEAAKKSG